MVLDVRTRRQEPRSSLFLWFDYHDDYLFVLPLRHDMYYKRLKKQEDFFVFKLCLSACQKTLCLVNTVETENHRQCVEKWRKHTHLRKLERHIAITLNNLNCKICTSCGRHLISLFQYHSPHLDQPRHQPHNIIIQAKSNVHSDATNNPICYRVS